MNHQMAFARLLAELEALQRVVQRQGVRLNNMFREGVVLEADPLRGEAVALAHGVETKPIPWLERAGSIVEWNPLAKGQRVMVVAPNGDLGRAFIIPGGFTNSVPQPDNRAAHKRTKIGNAFVTQSAGGLEILVDGARFVFSASGLTMTINGTEFAFTGDGFAQAGGTQEHDGKNVGRDHQHLDVLPGPARTGPPA
jgi:phage baseplate assembly protein gpV